MSELKYCRTPEERIPHIITAVEGQNIDWVIMAGVHRHENLIIPSVEAAIFRFLSQLPPSLIIPRAIPSIVRDKHRKITELGKEPVDPNRAFNQSEQPREVKDLINFISKYQDRLKNAKAIVFHEDIIQSMFYLYHTFSSEALQNGAGSMLFALMDDIEQRTKIAPYNGIDDVKLKNVVEGGLVPFDPDDGSFVSWFARNIGDKEVYEIEVPHRKELGGRQSQARMTGIAEAAIYHLIISRKRNE